MGTLKQMKEVTSDLLGWFSPHLHQMSFDFAANSLACEFYDDIERPASFRVLRFSRLTQLQIIPNDVEDIDPNCADSIIGADSDGEEFCLFTHKYEIFFKCGEFQAFTRSV
jgi:hypothetical protein